MENLDLKFLYSIERKEANNFLREIIDFSNKSITRFEAIKLLYDFDDKNNFNFLENLYLSDADREIALYAGNFIKEKYRFHKRYLSLFKFCLLKINDWEKRFIALEAINSLNNKSSNRLIKEFIKNEIFRKFKDRINEFPQEIFDDNNVNLSDAILNACFQLILYDYYTKICGYNATIRNGNIILLDCRGCGLNTISEIVGLSRLAKLEHLYLQNNRIESMRGVEYFKNLRTLNLSQNRIKKIEGLDSLSKLIEINLSDNNIEVIENLNHLKLLKTLDLKKNKIKKIEGLNGLKNLEKLDLSHNYIENIEGLDNLVSLKRLNLSYNKIKEISGLNNLENLNYIQLNQNKINKIQGLDKLIFLKGLTLNNNKIERIQGLDNLENLVKLELSSNKIKKIEGVNKLVKLQGLFLDNNQIEKIENLENLNDLITLFLKDNNISEYRKLKLPSLRYLFLNENPLTPESRRIYNENTPRFP